MTINNVKHGSYLLHRFIQVGTASSLAVSLQREALKTSASHKLNFKANLYRRNLLRQGMLSFPVDRGSFENQGQELKACKENLRRYHQLALAGRLVGATMHEVNNRLEALTNLIFLANHSDSSLRSSEYLDEADRQVCGLGEITSRSLKFSRLDIEAKEIDLVELADSALRLHHHQISEKRINVQTRSSETVTAFVKRGEIFQVVTNLLLTAIEALPDS